MVPFIIKGASYSYNSFFGANKDVVPMVAVLFLCNGNESSLNYCSNNTYNHYCDRAMGFTCSSKVNTIIKKIYNCCRYSKL